MLFVQVTTIDYNGSVQEHGGDPVEAQVIDDKGGQVDVQVNDRDDGTYEVRFTAMRPGTYCLKVIMNYLHTCQAKTYHQYICTIGSMHCNESGNQIT